MLGLSILQELKLLKMNYENLTIVPTCKIQPHQLTAYNSFLYNDKAIRFCGSGLKIPAITGSRPHVSKRSGAKIKSKINYLVAISNKQSIFNQQSKKNVNFNITFVTLTLASEQIHTDLELKNCLLHQFLIEISKKYNVKHYIWRFEKQRNFNTHFHLVINKFIPYLELRTIWNRIQNKLGYVDRYREEQILWHKNGFKIRPNLLKNWSYENQKKAYEMGINTGWSNPNSTDIHSVVNIKKISNYIIKYLTKHDAQKYSRIRRTECGFDRIDKASRIPLSKNTIKFLRQLASLGRNWGCSSILSKNLGTVLEIDNEINNSLEKLRGCAGVSVFDDKYFSVFSYDLDLLNNSGFTRLVEIISKELLAVFDFNYQFRI